MDTLRDGDAKAYLSDLNRPENRFERQFGPLYEVYTRIRAPDGAPLLFETYQRSSALISSGRQIWRPFAVALLAGLFLLWLIQVPLAWRLARRLQRSQLERERLLVHALEASADERRRIAADLHDGVVQDLAGMSFSLEAAAQDRREPPSPGLRATLTNAATTHAGVDPPTAHATRGDPPAEPALGRAGRRAGRPARAADGARDRRRPSSWTALSISVTTIELLVFRAARRGGQEHPAITHRRTTSRSGSRRPPERVRLQVVDDGVGFSAARRAQRQAEGHVGLALLDERRRRSRRNARRANPTPGAGTRFLLEVPRR